MTILRDDICLLWYPIQVCCNLVTWLPILATAAGYYTIYNASQLRCSAWTMDAAQMCFVIFLALLSGVVGEQFDLDRAPRSVRNDLDLVKERAYRSADPYMRHLLDSMQRNLAMVKKMCNAQYEHPRRGMWWLLSWDLFMKHFYPVSNKVNKGCSLAYNWIRYIISSKYISI